MTVIVVEMIIIIEFLFCFFPHIFSPGRHVKAAVQAKTGASDSDPAGDGDGGAEVPPSRAPRDAIIIHAPTIQYAFYIISMSIFM